MSTFFKTLFKSNKTHTIKLYNSRMQVIGVITGKDKKQLLSIASCLKQYLVNTPVYSLN